MREERDEIAWPGGRLHQPVGRGDILGAVAERLELEEGEVQEEFFERGWTDGLPVIPPTPERVLAMLRAADLEGGEILGTVKERSRSVSGEEAAINAVMAGCRPEYFPIVVAGVSAMLDPAYNANAALTSTGGTALCLVVSGPLAAEVGMNAGPNVLGQGNRANATIGRALRLVAMNVLGARPGGMDGASIGSPAKYSLCFAEDDPPDPWPPLRVELGYDRSETTVTLLPTEGPRQVANILNGEAEGVLLTMACAMRAAHGYPVGKGHECVVVLGPEHAFAVRSAGWTRARARKFLQEASRVSADELEAAGVRVERSGAHTMTPGEDGRYATISEPQDIFLVTAGGAGAGWSAYIPVWAPKNNARAVTRRVEVGV
jgi:hypothetical protein